MSFKNHEESTLWAAFATGALSKGFTAKGAAKEADAMLEEWRKRAEQAQAPELADAGAEDKSPEPPA